MLSGYLVRRGDAIVVGRIITWKSWLLRPLATAISWRIQQSTGSPWNHVACYIGNGHVVEAEWNCGVRATHLRSTYLTGEYRVAIVRPPSTVSAHGAVDAWCGAADDSLGIRSYSLRTLILMRIAALLFGAEGISKVIRNNPDDGAWICSELPATGWSRTPGHAGLRDLLVIPANYLDSAIGRELKLEQITVPNPKTISMED